MVSRPHADQPLQCVACGDSFIFTAGEQELNELRGIMQRPARCPPCTRLRPAAPHPSADGAPSA